VTRKAATPLPAACFQYCGAPLPSDAARGVIIQQVDAINRRLKFLAAIALKWTRLRRVDHRIQSSA
jgi:hypothetical protein